MGIYSFGKANIKLVEEGKSIVLKLYVLGLLRGVQSFFYRNKGECIRVEAGLHHIVPLIV